MKKHNVVILVIKVILVIWAIYSLYKKIEDILYSIKLPEMPSYKIIPSKGFIKTMQGIINPSQKDK